MTFWMKCWRKSLLPCSMRMSMSVMFRSSGPCPKGVRGLCLQCLVRCAAVSLFICMWHVSCQGWHECGAKCMVLLCFTSSLTTYTRRSCGNVATHIMLLEYEDFHKFPILSWNPVDQLYPTLLGGWLVHPQQLRLSWSLWAKGATWRRECFLKVMLVESTSESWSRRLSLT